LNRLSDSSRNSRPPTTVRLTGIDAPEHDQSFGAQSTQYLASLISGKTVNLECSDERSYGRLICKILLPNGEDADLGQLKTGMAWHYKQYQDEQSPADREAYASAECDAMKSRLGLWSDPHPVQTAGFQAWNELASATRLNGLPYEQRTVHWTVNR
jgi:endonuclease YncB( thermonuclease family)